MGEVFKSNSFGRPAYKHKELPVFMTDEFRFFRCVEFKDNFYGKTISELHKGNLRKSSGRYSALFEGQKISYWADSPRTARAEVKNHGVGKNIITFWAYDDVSSTFPTIIDEEKLIIIDGRKCGIQELIDKVDSGENLSEEERNIVKKIMEENPDCLVYDSRACLGGENYIFFEKGFRKLAIRNVKLYMGERSGKNTARIICADTSDYIPNLEAYGLYFKPIARTEMDYGYLLSEEYKTRKYNIEALL